MHSSKAYALVRRSHRLQCQFCWILCLLYCHHFQLFVKCLSKVSQIRASVHICTNGFPNLIQIHLKIKFIDDWHLWIEALTRRRPLFTQRFELKQKLLFDCSSYGGLFLLEQVLFSLNEYGISILVFVEKILQQFAKEDLQSVDAIYMLMNLYQKATTC